MTSVENQLSSYEVGKSPFRPDLNRGKWSSKYEFYLACIGHSFGVHTFIVLAAFSFTNGGVFNLFFVLLSVLFFLIPMYLIQSTLGQFSSTGCITVFRLSPIFKGIGYITTLLNLFSASFFSIPAAYSLLYLYASVNYELPWLSCNHSWNTANCSEILNVTYITLSSDEQSSASEFYMELTQYNGRGSQFSWHIFLALVVVWILVCLFVVKGVQMLGKVFWYTTLIPISILAVFVIRSFFTAGIGEALSDVFTISRPKYLQTALLAPFAAALLLGPGWNTVLTLASYNDFKTDVEKAAYIIPSILVGLSFVSGVVVMAVMEHIRVHVDSPKFDYNNDQLHFHFIVFTHFLGHIEAPHLWSLLYFMMLLLLELNSVVVQVFTVLTALYDEYVILRPYKKYISIGLCIFCCLFSTVYAFGDSLNTYMALVCSSDMIKGLVCFLELMIYVWIYGRIRFLRDITFLLGRSFAPWKFYIIRFITPIFAIIVLLFSVLFSFMYVRGYGYIIGFLASMSVWLFIPGYIVYILSTTTGTFFMRWRKCLRPTDWYPVELEHRNAYEAMLGTSNTSHQLVLTDSCNDTERRL